MVTKAYIITDEHVQTEEAMAPLWCSYRMVMTAMCFFLLLGLQMTRLNMSVGIVCMVNHTAASLQEHGDNRLASRQITKLSNGSANQTFRYNTAFNNSQRRTVSRASPSLGCDAETFNEAGEKREDGPFTWSKEEQGFILTSYYYGYVISLLPAASLINRFKNRCAPIAAIGIFLSSVISLITPAVAPYGLIPIVVLRVLIGCISGTFSPVIQHILSQWIPPSEIAVVTSLAYAGYSCGTLFTFGSSGFLCKYGFADGWQSIFYTYGILCLAIAVAWCVLVREDPAKHPWISDREKKYIFSQLAHRRNVQEKKSPKIPWKAILTSKPVYAVIAACVAIDVFSSIEQFFLPTYMAEIMKFRITSNGIVSSLPCIFQIVTQLLSGVISDLLSNRTSFSKGTVRKIVVCTGQFICAVTIFSVGFMGCEEAALGVFLLVLGVAPFGFISIGCRTNPIDIGPQFAGIINGLGCFISNLFALIVAMGTTAFLSQSSGRESWQIIFTSVAAFEIVTFLVYLSCASGEIQPWAESALETEMDVDVPLNNNNKKRMEIGRCH